MPLKLSRFFNPNLDKRPSKSNAGDECRLETSSLTSSHNSHQSAPGFIPTMFSRRLLMTKRTDDTRLSRSKSALGTKVQKSPKKRSRVGLKEKYKWNKEYDMMEDEMHEELTKQVSPPANDTLSVQSQKPNGSSSNNSHPLYHPVTGPPVGCPGYAWDPSQQTWIYIMPYGQPYSGPGWAPPKKAFQTLYPQAQGPDDYTGQGWYMPHKIQGPPIVKPLPIKKEISYYYPTAIQMGHRHSYNQLTVDARPAQMASSLTYRVSTSNITYNQSSYYGQNWEPPQAPSGANKPHFTRRPPKTHAKHASGFSVSQYNPSTFRRHQTDQVYQERLHSSSFTNAEHSQQPSAHVFRKKPKSFYEGPSLSDIPDHDISPLLIGVNQIQDGQCSRESLNELRVQEFPPNDEKVYNHPPVTDDKEVKIEKTFIEQSAEEANRAQLTPNDKDMADHEAVIEPGDIEAKQDLPSDKPQVTLLGVTTSPSITQGTFSTSASEAPDTASNVDQLDVTIITPISPLSQAAESQAPFSNEDEQRLETKDDEEEEWQYQRHQRKKMKNNFKTEPLTKPQDSKSVLKDIDDEVSEPGKSTQGHDARVSIELENRQLDNISSCPEDAIEDAEEGGLTAHQDLTTLKKSKGQKKRARAKAKKLEADGADNGEGNSPRRQKSSDASKFTRIAEGQRFSNNPWFKEVHRGTGARYIAKRDIPRGQTIMKELALINLPYYQPRDSKQMDYLFEETEPRTRTKMNNLRNHFPSIDSRLSRIKGNSITVNMEDGGYRLVVFENILRISKACRPNVRFIYLDPHNPEVTIAYLVAIDDIPAGHELFIRYGPTFFGDRNQRQRLLLQETGSKCQCKDCSSQSPAMVERSASNFRNYSWTMGRILRDGGGDYPSITLSRLEESLAIIAEERVWEHLFERFRNAWELCGLWGDAESTRAWMRLGRYAAVYSLGDEVGPMEYEECAKDPVTYPWFGSRGRAKLHGPSKDLLLRTLGPIAHAQINPLTGKEVTLDELVAEIEGW